MSPEYVVLVDPTGRSSGQAPKAAVHGAHTPLHLGFSCYVLDGDDRLLATRRSTTKLTFPGVWTNSFCGHPAPGESLPAAVRRRARHELGLELATVTTVLPQFRYRAEMNGVVEHELCPVTLARVASGTVVTAHPVEVEDWEWTPWRRFAREVTGGVRVVSPWCREQVQLLVGLGAPACWPDSPEALPTALHEAHARSGATG